MTLYFKDTAFRIKSVIAVYNVDTGIKIMNGSIT